MLLHSLNVGSTEFSKTTGWEFKPEGACKGAVCIPCDLYGKREINAQELSDTLGMPLVKAEVPGLWALGPESINSRALTDARAADLTLPDLAGNEFRLSSLLGQKVIVYAWAPY